MCFALFCPSHCPNAECWATGAAVCSLAGSVHTHFYKVTPPLMSQPVCGVNSGWPVIRKCFKFHIPVGQVRSALSLLLTATLEHQKTSCEAKAGAGMGYVLGCHNTFLLNESDKMMSLQRVYPTISTCSLWFMIMMMWGAFSKHLGFKFDSVLW